MEFVRQLLCTGIDDQDCNGTQEEIPRMDQFFQRIESSFLVSICIAAIMTGIVLVFGILHWAFVLKFISNEQIRTDLYWLVFMGPVVSLCGLVGLIIPRAAIFLYAIALVYFMICIFVLVCIMTTLNGSRQAMCDKLIARGVKISLQVCPIGCCFCCFSKLEPNERTFRRIEWLVFQSPIVRIFLEILNIIVFMEINSRASLFFQISNLIGIISLFIGSYGSYMIIPAGSSLLSEYRFLLLFRLVDFSQLAWSVQKFVVEFLAFPRLHIFSSETILPPSAKAQFCISFLLCLEMLIVTLLATWLFRPSQTWFFDKFRHCSLGGGRSCRIGHSSFCVDAKSVDFADLGRNGGRGPIHFYSQNGLDMANKFSESTLRLEQVRLNGSGHTVSTAADDAHSQQRRFSQGREYIVERENEGEEREEKNQEESSSRSESPKVPVEASQSTISVEEEGKGERERPKWTVKTD